MSYFKIVFLLALMMISACMKSNDVSNSDLDSTNASNPADANDRLRIISSNYTYLLDKVGPSVVSVDSYYVNKIEDDIFINDDENSGTEEYNGGSGIILDKDGYIITNAHVIEGSNSIKVTLKDKRVYMAKVVGIDSVSDLALLKIEAKDLIPIKIGNDKKVKVGQWVAALGAPFGFQFTLTSGIVSAKKRTIQDDPSYIPFLQTDAAINEGNSGGPLLNLDGEAIGLNTQIYSRSGGFVGIAFAIPIGIVMNVANQLKTTGKVQRVQLGVMVDGMSIDLAQTFGRNNANGALVLDVLDEHETQNKLKIGDIILGINGELINGPEDLPEILSFIKPGQKVALNIWRKSNQIEVPITLTAAQDLSKIKSEILKSTEFYNFQNSEIFAVEGMDVGLIKPNQEILSYYHLHSGMQIASIGGIAESLGFALGDIIVQVGTYKIDDSDDLKTALRNQKDVPVFLIRNFKPIFIPYLGKLSEEN